MRPIGLLVMGLGLSGCTDMICSIGTHLDEEEGLCLPGSRYEVLDTGLEEGTPHPLAPEQYAWLWRVNGCDEGTGHSVYMHLHDATSTPTEFTGTEDWYWFWAEPGWANDCVDTFEVTGSWYTEDFADMGCAECDEGWDLRRKLVNTTCNIPYDYYLSTGAGDGSDFWSLFLLDSLTPSGTPNMDNKFFAFEARARSDGTYRARDLDTSNPYVGTLTPHTEVHGPPADYEWVGEDCRG